MKLLGHRPGAKLRRALRHVRYLWELDRAYEALDHCLVRGILDAIQDGGKPRPHHRGKPTGRTRDKGTATEYECRDCGERWWDANIDEMLRQAYSGEKFQRWMEREAPIHRLAKGGAA
jgi:hypothetical protein